MFGRKPKVIPREISISFTPRVAEHLGIGSFRGTLADLVNLRKVLAIFLQVEKEKTDA